MFQTLDVQGHIWQFDTYLKQMDKLGVKPNMETYTIIIESYRRHKIGSKVLQIYQHMKRRNLVPSSRIWTAVMEQFDEDGDSSDVLICYEQMQAFSVARNVRVYRLVASTLPNLPYRSEKIFRFLAAMQDDGLPPDTHIYREIVAHLRAEGGLTTCEELAQAVVAAGIELTVAFFECLMQEGQYLGNKDAVIQAFETLKHYHLSPTYSTYLLLVSTYVHFEDLDKAFAIAAGFDRKPRRGLQQMLVQGFLAQRKRDTQLQTCLDCIAKFQSHDLPMHANSIAILSGTLKDDRNALEKLLSLTKQSSEQSIVHDKKQRETAGGQISTGPGIELYHLVMEKCLEVGDWPAFTLHLHEARSKWNIRPTAVTYKLLIRFLGAVGRTDDLFDLPKTMLDSGVQMDSDTLAVLLTAHVEAGLSAEDAETLLAELKQLHGVSISTACIKPLLTSLLVADRLRDALRLLVRARDPKLHDASPTAGLCAALLGYVSLRPDIYGELASESGDLLKRFPEDEGEMLDQVLLIHFDNLCVDIYKATLGALDTWPHEQVAGGEASKPRVEEGGGASAWLELDEGPENGRAQPGTTGLPLGEDDVEDMFSHSTRSTSSSPPPPPPSSRPPPTAEELEAEFLRQRREHGVEEDSKDLLGEEELARLKEEFGEDLFLDIDEEDLAD